MFIPEEGGDGFDDIADGSRFFSEGSGRNRWAVAQNARCDLLVRRPGTGPDRVVEILFFEKAGNSRSNWSVGSLKTPFTDFRAVRMQVATRDGSAFSGKIGRIEIGFIGGTGLTARRRPLTGLAYDEQSFAASLVAGVQLDGGARPFWHTDPPYTERIYPPIPMTDLSSITISVGVADKDLTMHPPPLISTIARTEN